VRWKTFQGRGEAAYSSIELLVVSGLALAIIGLLLPIVGPALVRRSSEHAAKVAVKALNHARSLAVRTGETHYCVFFEDPLSVGVFATKFGERGEDSTPDLTPGGLRWETEEMPGAELVRCSWGEVPSGRGRGVLLEQRAAKGAAASKIAGMCGFLPDGTAAAPFMIELARSTKPDEGGSILVYVDRATGCVGVRER